MRSGFSTGSCAAAAAEAAARMLLSQKTVLSLRLLTPKGVFFDAEILDSHFTKEEAVCAVRKDGGDDPDITTGALIYARVCFVEHHDTDDNVIITGGKGVGIVTKPGLDQLVGEAAINSGPRKQIRDAVFSAMEDYGADCTIKVEISVPGGEELAKKTFNPRLGICGGISILGTSGTVEPMSSEALLSTIRLSLKQRSVMGDSVAVLVPGNMGLSFLAEEYNVDANKCVICGNYIGNTIDMASQLGFKEVLLAGHIGKLIKLSLGIMNTHSKESDGRLEAITVAALEAGIGEPELLRRVLDCNTTEEAVLFLNGCGGLFLVMSRIMKRIGYYLKKRAGEALRAECVVFSQTLGKIGATEGARELLERL